MKKKNLFSTLMLGAALIAGLASCNKDAAADGGVADGATGSLKITLGFDKPVRTYATPSSAKPTTTWKDNIHSLAIFCTDAAGVIKYAADITYDANDDTQAQQIKTLSGIPADTYTVYVFANYDQGKSDWSVATAKGKNITALYMDVVTNEDFEDNRHKLSTEVNSVGYGKAPEVFVAVRDDVEIEADGTHVDSDPYMLTRIVGLVRVRIDQSVGNADNHNDYISFTDEGASLRLRRINTGINLKKEVRCEQSDKANAVFFDGDPFLATEPVTGYDTGDADNSKVILTDKFTSWKDVIVLPAGDVDPDPDDEGAVGTGANKLDVVVIGVVTEDDVYTPAGYPKMENGVEVKFAPKGEQIAWAGAVTGKVVGNGILELNLTLKSAGTWVDPNDEDKPLPEPGLYGSLDIEVGLADWGAISSVDMDM